MSSEGLTRGVSGGVRVNWKKGPADGTERNAGIYTNKKTIKKKREDPCKRQIDEVFGLAEVRS